MAHPPVVIVDENDKVIGEMMVGEAWKTGAYHRLVRVIVEDRHGRILLQRRAKHMKLYPGCWGISAAGHVDAGMTYEAAARQELIEELSLADGELEELGYYQTNKTYEGHEINRFNRVFRLRWNYTPELLPPDEVSEVRWFTKEELLDLVDNHPEHTSDDLRESAEYLREPENRAAAQPAAAAGAIQ